MIVSPKLKKQKKYEWNEETEAAPPTKRSREFPWKNNETDLFNLINTEDKKELMKILKKLRAIDRNAAYYYKELETIKRNQEKLENSFTKMKDELKAMTSRMNTAENK